MKASIGAIVVGAAILVAGCGGATTHASSTATQHAPTAVALPTGSRLLLKVPEPLSHGYLADGSLYLANDIPAAEHTAYVYEMVRVDTATGRVVASRRFSTGLDSTMLVGGSLWATTSSGSETSLWRLNPLSLAVRSEQNLPASTRDEGITGSLAVAGGQLWVGTGKLDGVSLSTGRLDRVVTPRYPGPVQLAASSTGDVLLASLGYEHPTYIARLDPRTVAVLSTVTVPQSVTQPRFGGVVAGGAWIENTVGTRTTAWRVSLATLKPTRTSLWATTSSRISLQVLDGRLWVTQPLGTDNLNYCANPVTAGARAAAAATGRLGVSDRRGVGRLLHRRAGQCPRGQARVRSAEPPLQALTDRVAGVGTGVHALNDEGPASPPAPLLVSKRWACF